MTTMHPMIPFLTGYLMAAVKTKDMKVVEIEPGPEPNCFSVVFASGLRVVVTVQERTA